MKPLKVEFQAFGPYADHEIVDFRALSSNGLFLICGKTGIGKTTILDAMTFALYGKSSGHARDDFSSMRCTNADFGTSTFVKFEFISNGKEYLFERRLDRKTKNLAPAYSAMQKDEDGNWNPFFENAKERALNDKAVEIIGLEYEQFRQVMVLPQGQFEKFLTSNADEKEKILVSIFGEDKWNTIAKYFFDEAIERLNKLEKIEEGINTRLTEEGCKSIRELKDIVEAKENDLRRLEEEHKKADYDKIIKEQTENLELVQRFSALREAETKLKGYEEQDDEYKLWKKQDEEAAKAEKLRPLLISVDDSAKNLALRQQAEVTAKSNETEKSEALEKVLSKLNEHKQSEAEIKNITELKISYENKRKDYEDIDSAKADFDAKKEAEKKALDAEETSQKKIDAYIAKINAQNNVYDDLDKAHQDMLKIYISGITGELARDLKEGDACPVCGSTTHPHKAEISEGSVTKAQVDSKKKEADDAYKVLQDLMREQQQAQNDLTEKKNIASSLSSEVIAAKTRYEGLAERLIEGIESLSELTAEINKLETKINEYNETLKDLEAQNKTANDELTSAKALVATAQKETKDADDKLSSDRKLLETELQKYGFTSEDNVREAMLDDEAHESLKKSISDYEFDYKKTKDFINELSEELSGKNEPDKEQCEEIIKNANDSKQAYATEYGKLSGELSRLTVKVKELEKENNGLDEKLLEARQDCTFARKLRGDAGMGLQRYVLGIMFSSVVAAANNMLEMVHGGRYRLFRSDDKVQGSNKRGLELKVFDKYSEDQEGRFVSTLSGGEKFLVSLALSIGMSTIAQKSGIKIEALFIDEGFGSLDEESISDAMNILNTIQNSNGIVGIISHVQILQERIPTKLIVERIGKGSHIVHTVG